MRFSKGTRLIASILLACTAVSLASCGGKGGSTTTTQNTEVTNNMPQDNAPEYVSQAIGSLSRQAAAEGMVLLKNQDNVLPLTSASTVAIFGKGQIELVKGGTGSGDVKSEHIVGLLEGMEAKQTEGKINIYQPLADKYKADANYNPTDAEVQTAAASADTAIYVITRNSGEGGDRSADAGDYKLSSGESRFLETLRRSGFTRIVIVLNIGGMMDTTKLLSYNEIKSILLAWQPGEDGGHAIADILVGDVTPSGKLADTFAKSYNDYPSSAGFHEDNDYVNYTEDIFVGYRYFETFDPNYEKVNFEFGFGLSYTTFDISNVNVSVEGENIVVKVKVTNTGNYAGKEVVQVYYSAPQGLLGNPAKELAAFAKSHCLAPGDSEELTMSFAIADMASYDDTGKVQKSAYVMEAGDYNIYVGNSVRNAGEAGVRYTYKVQSLETVAQLTEQVSAKLLPERLLADGSYENVYDYSGIATELGAGVTRIAAVDYYAKHRHADIAFSADGQHTGFRVNGSGEGHRYAIYAVDAPAAGEYNLTLGFGSYSDPISEAVKVFVNNNVQVDKVLTVPKTGDYWTSQNTESVTLTLEEGLNFVKIEFLFDGKTVMLNYVEFEAANASNGASASASASSAPSASASAASVSVASSAATGTIKFNDVMADPSLMGAFLDQLTELELINLLHGYSGKYEDTLSETGSIGGLDKFGIPSIETADGPAGIRLKTKTSTAYPIETALACTWNTEILYRVGEAIAADAKANKVDIWLAPAVNIHRNPLTGRNFEYYSEDPYLSGMMASAIINGVQDNGIGVMLKHFVANEKETNRVYSDTRVTERALREIYLKPFQIAIEKANPWVIMSSYNKINGVYTAENKSLLTEILRNEWGYEGMVSSDWWNTSVAYKELLAGESLKMKSGDTEGIYGAYHYGILSREDIEWHVQKVLELIIKAKSN